MHLRLFGPCAYDEESPLQSVYWRTDYLLARLDALYLDSEDVLTLIHYMRPTRLHHHDQRGILNVAIHRGPAAGTPDLGLIADGETFAYCELVDRKRKCPFRWE